MKLRIIQTSDIHGCFFPYDFLKREKATASLSQIASYVKKQRETYGNNLILLDAGDIIQGQPSCYYCNYIKHSIPNVAASVLNHLKYDAVTIGNHDIETGHNVYDKWRDELLCPVLAANVINKITGKPYFKPYTIIRRGNVKIAILGMITSTIPYWLNENLWSGMKFLDAKECSRQWVDFIRKTEKPDILIGLFHTGWDGGIANDTDKENSTKEIANEVAGLDIILFGHDHCCRMETITTQEDNVICLNPSSNAYYVAEVDIIIEKENGIVRKKEITGSIKSLEAMPSDKLFMEHFKDCMQATKDYTEREIGFIGESIYTRDCYFGDAPLNDLMHEIQLEVTGAQISLCAPLCYDECLYKGKVHISDLFNLYKYENQIYALTLTGCEIKTLLENSYDLWINTMTSPNDHIIRIKEMKYEDFSLCLFQNLTFNFDTAAGINYIVDVRKAYGEKIHIKNLTDGTPFENNEFYTVAMHSYRANGGTEFLTKATGLSVDGLKKRVVFVSKKSQRYYLEKKIEKERIIRPITLKNWHFEPQSWTEEALRRDKFLLFGI